MVPSKSGPVFIICYLSVTAEKTAEAKKCFEHVGVTDIL